MALPMEVKGGINTTVYCTRQPIRRFSPQRERKGILLRIRNDVGNNNDNDALTTTYKKYIPT